MEEKMSKTQQRVIKLISQAHVERSKHEIDLVLPWLKKKSDVMRNLEDCKNNSLASLAVQYWIHFCKIYC